MQLIKTTLLFTTLLIAGVASAQQTETRGVPVFDKIRISGSFDVVLKHGNESSVKITATNIDTKKVLTEIEGDQLNISLEKGQYNNIRLKVEVTYKHLEAIDKSGSGNLSCQSDLSSPANIDISLHGSGNLEVKGTVKAASVAINRNGSGNMQLSGLEAEEINMNFSGSGNFEVNNGSAKTQRINLNGSGNVSAFGLKTEECSAVVSGSGDIQVSVSRAINAAINGSGNIDYRGNAQVSSIEVHGSGRIHKQG